MPWYTTVYCTVVDGEGDATCNHWVDNAYFVLWSARSVNHSGCAWRTNISSAAFLGRRQPRLPAGLQLRLRRCQLPYRAFRCVIVLVQSYAAIWSYTNICLSLLAQEPKPRPCSTIPFGEKTTLSIATRLVRYKHGVLNRLLEWHLLGWEASGYYEPTREIEMRTERVKQVTAGNRVRLPSLKPFTETWVFWVHANSTARIEKKDRRIAEAIRLSERNYSKIDILIAICSRLAVRRIE